MSSSSRIVGARAWVLVNGSTFFWLPAMSRRHMLVIERVERSRLEQAATTPRIGARSAMDICIASAFAMVAENVYRSGKKNSTIQEITVSCDLVHAIGI